MPAVEAITLAVDAPAAASRLYLALGLEQVRLRAADDAPTSGFRGFALSLVAADPAAVDALMTAAVDAGATPLQPAHKSLWGYGGSVQAADGTVITLASASKRSTGKPARGFDSLVLQLGVADVAASRAFYADRGFAVAKSYGRKYVELDTGPITVSLNARRAVAKAAGIDQAGSGSHRLALCSDAGAFTDPDGFAWEPA